jgi:hypothetical protein
MVTVTPILIGRRESEDPLLTLPGITSVRMKTVQSHTGTI